VTLTQPAPSGTDIAHAWRLVAEDENRLWAEALAGIPDAPIFQHWGWGEFQRRSGWRPLRFIHRERDRVTLAQVLCRRMPGGIDFAWVPGGPITDDPERLADRLDGLHSALKSRVGRCYMRCNVMSAAHKTDFFTRNDSVRRARRPVNSRYSVFLDLTVGPDAWLRAMTKKHRYYVRLANRQGIEWRTGTDDGNLRALAELLRGMVGDKQISIPIYSHDELVTMNEYLGDAMTVIVGYHDGEPISGALVLTHGNRAHYLAAATSRKGRTMSAAYSMMWELHAHLRRIGVTIFDLGGIAPHDERASGVDHFKLGFGGEVVEYLGEWEMGTAISRTLGNSAVTRIIRSGPRSRNDAERSRAADWSVWDGSPDEWDDALRSLDHPSVYQSHRWGEHRRQFGWTPVRLVARRGDRIVAMVHVQTRRYLSVIGLVWSPGGPVGDLGACGRSMRHAISRAIGARYAVFRVNVMRPYDDAAAALLARQGWIGSPETILSGLSLVYELGPDAETRESLLSKNWRHNLRRGLKRATNAYHWEDPSAPEMKRIYDSMHEFKGLEHLAAQNSLESISSIISSYGDQCVVVRCDDSEGRILAIRGALIMGDRAWDTFAAATPEGRKVYASYTAFWRLMELCRERGVCHYDMGGGDPIHNRGVYDFKHGTGAEVVRFLGEWEHSQPRILGVIAGRGIARRLR